MKYVYTIYPEQLNPDVVLNNLQHGTGYKMVHVEVSRIQEINFMPDGDIEIIETDGNEITKQEWVKCPSNITEFCNMFTTVGWHYGWIDEIND